jgi:hypothetical protein
LANDSQYTEIIAAHRGWLPDSQAAPVPNLKKPSR